MESLIGQEELTYGTSSAVNRSSGKTPRQWHSQPHQLQHELEWLLLLAAAAAAAISWYCRK